MPPVYAFKPTPEQSAIIEAAVATRESLMVEALAGCAKTTTLEHIAWAVPGKGPHLALAFNVKIKTELSRRLPESFEVKTLNGLGHNAFSKAIGKRLALDEGKLGRLIREVGKADGWDISGDLWAVLKDLVTLAMQRGLVPSDYPNKSLIPDSPESWQDLALDAATTMVPEPVLALARKILVAHIKEAFAGKISFDDQIYMSAMFNGVFPKHGLVMVDEAQDLSPLNHIMVGKCLGPSSRLIVVGDPRQAIYAFRGADSQSMESMRRLRPTWRDLPLNTTFRCPKVIVQRQLYHAPDFVAASQAPEGQVLDWHQRPAWTLADVAALPDLAILCRNNGPLFSMAMRFLRHRQPCVMLGRDIGKGLIALSKKLAPDDDTPSEEVLKAIALWAGKEIANLKALGKEARIQSIEDRSESLQAIAMECPDAGSLRQALSELFSRDAGGITLATGHRSKGLEWTYVLILDPWRIPSKYALRAEAEGDPRPMVQEANLRYVMETRSKATLILADFKEFTVED